MAELLKAGLIGCGDYLRWEIDDLHSPTGKEGPVQKDCFKWETYHNNQTIWIKP